MEEELFLTDHAKGIVLFVIAYLLFRVSKYGEEKMDRYVMLGSAGVITLTLGAYFVTQSGELLSSLFLVALGWGMVVMWFGKIPGLRLHLPEGKQRTAIYIEFAAVALAAFILISFWA